jgi:hypothetical protein
MCVTGGHGRVLLDNTSCYVDVDLCPRQVPQRQLSYCTAREFGRRVMLYTSGGYTFLYYIPITLCKAADVLLYAPPCGCCIEEV